MSLKRRRSVIDDGSDEDAPPERQLFRVTLANDQISECIRKRMANWRFPRPKGGVHVAVTYPFVFKTLGRE